MRKIRLDDEKSGTNENTNKNEQKPLFFEEIIDGSRERSGWVFQALW